MRSAPGKRSSSTSRLATAWAVVLVLASLLACRLPRSAGDGEGSVTIEYVPIAIAWVRRHVPVTDSALAEYRKTDAGKRLTEAEIRHILVLLPPRASARDVAAARARAADIAARVQEGEDFQAIAREESDDQTTRATGGSLGRDPSALPEPLRRTAKALGPGEMATEPVRDRAGFHVIMRDHLEDGDLKAEYKKTRAPELARKLADEMLARMRASSEPLDEIAKDSVRAILGEAAVSDGKRRGAVSLPPGRASSADLPEDAQEGLAAFARKAQPGDITDSALGTGPVLVVARAVAAK